MSELKITVQHIKSAGFCVHVGARRFCAAHGLDFHKLMHGGIPVSEVAGIQDALLDRVLIEVYRDGQQ